MKSKLYIHLTFFSHQRNKERLRLFERMWMISWLISCTVIQSCDDFVQTDPPITQLVTDAVFVDDVSATATVIGIYSRMMSSQNFASTLTTTYSGLSSDEFKSVSQDQFHENSLTETNTSILDLWRDAYQFVYATNAILEGLANSAGVTMQVKKQLEGEAKFIRAFCHFYLVNLFGDVPLITTTDYRVNAVMHRTSSDHVYQQIISDLKDAQILLNENYITTERIRPNRWAATALLARVYLYTNDWQNAEEQATSVINNVSTYSLVENLDNVFLKNSTEAIWQMMPVAPGYNTYEGNSYILTVAPTSFILSDQMVSAFEIGDNRKVSWVGSITPSNETYYYPFKYKVIFGSSSITEYYMVLRLAEQYLIRAEARAQQNNIQGSQADINIIRARAGLPDVTASDKTFLLQAIEHERHIELFAEWGHRWFDLKRTKRADPVLSVLKSPNWQSMDMLFPIPSREIINNVNLTQNPGY